MKKVAAKCALPSRFGSWASSCSCFFFGDGTDLVYCLSLFLEGGLEKGSARNSWAMKETRINRSLLFMCQMNSCYACLRKIKIC